MRLTYVLRRAAPVLAFVLISAFSAQALAQVDTALCPKRKGRKYKVRIESAPPGAQIYLDDERCGLRGYAPWDGRLEKGDWKVIIKLDGYETATRMITVTRTSRVQEIFVPLVKKDVPAEVEVTAAADPNTLGAEVYVDGQLQGTVPLLAKVPKGRHQVKVSKQGYLEFAVWIDVGEGQKQTISPILKPEKKEPKKGSILVDADVSAAEVWIDGVKWRDTTPTLVPDLEAGTHVVEVRKEPAMPWKQTVVVEEGRTTKVTAAIQASMGGPTGAVRVMSNVPGAEVFVDGELRGKVPLDIKDLKPGKHIVEVKAPGYMTRDEEITVSAGSATVLKLDLSAQAASGETGTIKVVSPVPEATVSIDGERIGSAPQSKDVPPGEHFVVVEKAGYKTFKEKIKVSSGQTVSVTAELKAVGTLRVLSTPAGSTVMIDGEPVGATPIAVEDVEVGDHIVQVTREDYYNYEQNVKIEGGKTTVINAQLEFIDIGPTEEELRRQQRGLTSFGARTLPKGKSTISLGTGYPYYIDGKIMVGAGNLGTFGFDAGLTFRSYLSRTELGLDARIRLVEQEPFSLAAFGTIGGGSNFFDDSFRNSFFLDAGALASLAALQYVTITGRVYINFWSDRHCPAFDGSNFEEDSDPIDVCQDYATDMLAAEDRERIDELFGGPGEIFERDNGMRLMTSLIVEVAVKQRWSFWIIFEGAPFQEERPAFLDFFNAPLFEEDIGTYVRAGGTYKF